MYHVAAGCGNVTLTAKVKVEKSLNICDQNRVAKQETVLVQLRFTNIILIIILTYSSSRNTYIHSNRLMCGIYHFFLSRSIAQPPCFL